MSGEEKIDVKPEINENAGKHTLLLTESEEEHDPYFEPVIELPLVQTKSLEEDEEVVWRERAKLYRYDDSFEVGRQWKERGTGEVKLLQHKKKGCVRLLMRREQTLKVCANHYIAPNMSIHQHSLSDRTWLWSTPADFSEEQPRSEVLAMRFKTADIAMVFRERFNEAKAMNLEYEANKGPNIDETTASDVQEEVTKGIENITIKSQVETSPKTDK